MPWFYFVSAIKWWIGLIYHDSLSGPGKLKYRTKTDILSKIWGHNFCDQICAFVGHRHMWILSQLKV